MKLSIKTPSLRRPSYGLAAMVMTAVALMPVFGGSASAYEQLNIRSIQMSSSAPSAAAVKYTIGFDATSTTAIQAIVIDFCDESPIIGSATCTKPTGMTVGGTVGATVTGLGTNTGWTGAVAGNGHVLTLSNNANVTAPSLSGSTIEVTGFTNPSTTNRTFYARILTYASTTTGYGSPNSGTIGTPLDAGGAALSTSTAVSVSGTVQETLTFCTSGSSALLGAGTCAANAGTAPAITLGAGTPAVLDSSDVYSGSIYSKTTTNAGGGVAIRMRTNNSCAGLSRDGGTTCEIAGAATTTAAALFNNGDAKIGLQVVSSGGTGTLTSEGQYQGTGDNYGMGNDVFNNAYGTLLTQSSGVLSNVDTTYTFGASASPTTPAGVYTASYTLIATGTY